MSITIGMRVPDNTANPVRTPTNNAYTIYQNEIEIDPEDFGYLYGLGYIPTDPTLAAVMSASVGGGSSGLDINGTQSTSLIFTGNADVSEDGGVTTVDITGGSSDLPDLFFNALKTNNQVLPEDTLTTVTFQDYVGDTGIWDGSALTIPSGYNWLELSCSLYTTDNTQPLRVDLYYGDILSLASGGIRAGDPVYMPGQITYASNQPPTSIFKIKAQGAAATLVGYNTTQEFGCRIQGRISQYL